MPDLADTQAIPGLGRIEGLGGGSPGTARPAGSGQEAPDAAPGGAAGRQDDSAAAVDAAGRGKAAGYAEARSGGTAGDTSRRGGGRRGHPAAVGAQQPRAAQPRFWREIPVFIVVILVLALVMKAFVIQAFYIPSASMENTLKIGDRVFINKVIYHLRPIHRGDIVVFDGTGSWNLSASPSGQNIFTRAVDELEGLVGISHDSSIYIKRVIGLPGDHVVCCNALGQVTVNGVPLSESSYVYPGNAPSAQRFNITVPAGRLWVMGDHRAVSYDSRGHMGDPGGGTIPESAVLGRAFVIIWPPSRWGFLNIPATFEQPRLNSATVAAAGPDAATRTAAGSATPIRPAGSPLPLPLALSFACAVPLTWLRRAACRRLRSRRLRSRRLRLGRLRSRCRGPRRRGSRCRGA